MDKQRWGNIGLGLLAVLAVVMVVLAMTRQGGTSADAVGAPPNDPAATRTSTSAPASPSGSARPTATTAPTKASDPSAPTAVFIGDSYAAGAGGDGTTWTGLVAEKMGWNETNLARGGTGYVTSVSGPGAQAACGLDSCPAYPGMVKEAAAADPAVIVVSGGRNDGSSSVTNAAATLYLDLHKAAPKARIIVVSPLWDDDPVPADLTGTKQGVRVAANAAGVQYLDIGQPLTGRADLVAPDGVHPNAAGQQAIAKAVLAKLK
ncbi:Lysophospholipase L1 [Raineyella antarctica]|uniref:Lysophospholipase L1 n=1 Tax=Raineyella antarctica TaxID=1577474 RepID=A0A1G6GEH2_9ACTN|nr:SGNH/GDSL hydrolase family protein [Raineyella antarctica]SDB80377.1 Lysophospholipase L1 [Raineyella antarctica]